MSKSVSNDALWEKLSEMEEKNKQVLNGAESTCFDTGAK